ncbi:MAG TPA: hypothetical protein VIZ61_05270 [Solirubrobacterales bacterium]
MGLGSASRRRRRLGLAVPVAVAIILAGAVSAGAVALHALTPKGCIADTGDAAGCGSNAQGLDGGEDVAVSPDGASVYAVSFFDDAIVRFDRAANGVLSAPSCIADVGDVAGCGATAQGLAGPSGVAVSPDGASVYAASPRRDTALVPDASSYLSRSSTALDT